MRGPTAVAMGPLFMWCGSGLVRLLLERAIYPLVDGPAEVIVEVLDQ